MADQVQAPPHDVLLALALGMVMAGPSLLGDVGGTMMDLLGPAGVLLLPIILIVLARFLSTDQGAGIYNSLTAGRSYDSTHAVYLVLLLFLLVLFYKRLFSGGEDEEEE